MHQEIYMASLKKKKSYVCISVYGYQTDLYRRWIIAIVFLLHPEEPAIPVYLSVADVDGVYSELI